MTSTPALKSFLAATCLVTGIMLGLVLTNVPGLMASIRIEAPKTMIAGSAFPVCALPITSGEASGDPQPHTDDP